MEDNTFLNANNLYEDVEGESGKTLSLEEVELNEPYEIVVTTNGGLWRYRLEDTIIFTSLNPFKIKVTGNSLRISIKTSKKPIRQLTDIIGICIL